MPGEIKVIHAPLEIAGQVGLICEFLRKNGIHSSGYNYFMTYFNYKKVIHADSYEMVKMLEDAIGHFDLFHLHNGYTFLDDKRDIPMIAQAGKKIVMHHRGNDVRSRKRAAKGNGYENRYVDAGCSIADEEIENNLRLFAQYVSAVIVQDYELFLYVEDYYAAAGKKVHVLPRLIDTEAVHPVYEHGANDVPLIVHAPTMRDFKGTAHIEEAISRLQKEMPLNYRRVEEMSHEEALELYQHADIIVDQVLCGAYGNLSVEGMALGKPVVCYIRPDLVNRYPPGLPIVSANPDNVHDVLKMLVRDREQRIALGRQGRSYVENHHAADKVIQQLIGIYQEVLGGNHHEG